MISYIIPLIIFQALTSVHCNLVWETPSDALDNPLYESVLDSELCDQQVKYIRRNAMLLTRFLDSGIRTPRGILTGNTLDLGNYFQCLGINEEWEDSSIQGKYCRIRVPLSQSFEFDRKLLPEELDFNPSSLKMDNGTIRNVEEFYSIASGLRSLDGFIDERLVPGSPFAGMTFRLAVCIPRPCTTEQAMTSLLFNLSAIGFQYHDDYCRLPNDKPWTPADYALVVVFSVLGLLTVLCTSFDIYQTIFLKKNPKTVSVYGRMFSVVTNGKRLTNFSNSGALDCIDGIRAIAIIWVVLGHSFTSEPNWANPIDTFQWSVSAGALWITGAHITVDTFFLLSGILVVYTTASKLTGMNLLKNLHLFYLNRLLRMFPLLAAGVLLEASFYNRVTDGPDWGMVVSQVDRCRTFWWSTLLHIQNYLTPSMTCIGQTWYLAIDVQSHILSPLVLFWVLRGRRSAWIALTTGLLVILTASTTYNFIKNFPSTMMHPNRGSEFMEYMQKYYINTLTRASPFVVGMFVGYLLHVWRDEKLNVSRLKALALWIFAFSLSTFVIYTNYPIVQMSWDNQLLDNIYNSFIRPIWASAVGIMIYLCVQGYGGPINWFLSLDLWKMIARISYGMYIFHFALMTAVNSTAIAPLYFTVGTVTFKALAHLFLTIIVSFFMTLLIDAPFSMLFKKLLGKGSHSNKGEINVKDATRINRDEKQK